MSLIYIYVKYKKRDHLNQIKGALWGGVLLGPRKRREICRLKVYFRTHLAGFGEFYSGQPIVSRKVLIEPASTCGGISASSGSGISLSAIRSIIASAR